MADNIGYTAGSGTLIKTDQDPGDAAHMQVIKLAISGDGLSTLVPADAANGLDVDVTRVGGNVTVVQATAANLKVDASGAAVPVTDNASSLTVDAPVATPVFVRLSDGAAAIAALPVTDNAGSLSVDDGAGSLTVDGTVAATQSGTWNVGTVTGITNVVHVDDNAATLSVDDGAGSLTVDGSVTAAQGTAAAASGAWPVKISNGVDTAGISDVSGAKALKVDVVQSVISGVQTDKSTFTEGTGKLDVVGGVYNEAISADPTEDQAAAARITAKRALHVNIRKVDGTELGISATPLRTDPTGTTPQPVTDNAGSLTVDAPVATPVAVRLSDGAAFISALPVTDNAGSLTVDGTVTANQGGAPWTEDLTKIAGNAIVAAASGIQKVGVSDEVGASFSDTNPLPVSCVSLDRTRFTNSNTVAASETAIAVWTPGSGKKFVVTSLTVTASVGGVFTLYDATNSATNLIFKGTLPVGVTRLDFSGHPWVSAAINNVLRYTTGTGVVAELQVHGYESV